MDWRILVRRRGRSHGITDGGRLRGGCRPRAGLGVSRARRFRAHLIKYFSGMRGVVDMKRGLNDIASSADVLRAMDLVFAQNPDEA